MFDSTLDRDYTLDLDLDLNYYEVHSFLSEAKYKKLPQYKKLNIYPLSKLSTQGQSDLNSFLECTTPDGLKILSVCSGGFTAYQTYKKGLSVALKYVKEQIYLSNFILDAESLKEIIEKANRCSELVFAACKFLFVNNLQEDTVLTRAFSEFELNKLQNYQIKMLTFFGTYPRENDEIYRVDRLTMKTIFHELGKTSLKNSLEIIKMHPSWFSVKELQAILDENGFDVEIVTDFEHRPKK